MSHSTEGPDVSLQDSAPAQVQIIPVTMREDWSGMSRSADRRRLQNRLNQRASRESWLTRIDARLTSFDRTP